jgi:BON domain
MLSRRAMIRASILSLSLVLLAAWNGRAHAQSGAGGGAGGAGGGGGSGGSGSSASGVGGGFTGGAGGSSGSSASGVGGGYTGGSAASGGGFTGGAGMGRAGAGAGGASGAAGGTPSSANPFISTYTNPLVAGLVSTSGTQTTSKPFGQPIYSVYSTATTGTTTTSNTGVGFGYNTFGQARTYNYAATLSDDVPRVVHASPQMQAALADVLRRTTALKQTTPLQVKVNGSTVFLEGAVASAKEKRVVEGMIRMTPGVRNVVNNLEVSEVLPPPRTGLPMGP